MFSAGSITGTFGLNEKPAVDAIKNVEREAVAAKQKIGPALEIAGVQGAKGFLSGINSELGKRSALGQFTKLAMGGGAIAGLGMATRELNNFTHDLLDMKQAWNDNTISAGEFFEKVASSIPVLGEGWLAGRNIREMFTGQDADEAKATANEKKHIAGMNAIAKAEKDFLNARKQINDSFADMTKAAGRESALMGAPDMFKGILGDSFALEDKLAKVQEARDKVKALVDSTRSARDAKVKQYGSTEFMGEQIRDAEATIARGAAPKDMEDALVLVKGHREEVEALNRALAAEEAAQGRLNTQADAAAAAIKKTAGEKMMGDVWKGAGDFLGGLHLGDKVKDLLGFGGKGAISGKEFMQLPNPRLLAEELRGPKTVTTGDVPQPFVEMQRSEAATAENTARMAAGIEQLVRQGSRVNAGLGQTDPLSLPG